jgi:hypothetical protein
MVINGKEFSVGKQIHVAVLYVFVQVGTFEYTDLEN